MFTGIIEELGIIKDSRKLEGKVVISIENANIFLHSKVNDSIAVNGCCLTIVKIEKNIAYFDILPESLSRTNLALLQKNDIVNLESSLTLQSKLGGHIVQGHIDCTACIKKIQPDGDSHIFTFELAKDFLDMLVPKAFIGIDGISLTITEVTTVDFSVMVIPHTKKITIAKNWKIGTLVNIEVDIMNKNLFYFLRNFKLKIDKNE